MALWIIGYPIWDLADMSLHSVNDFGQLKDYSGFANFSKLIAEPLFFECLIRTLVWTVRCRRRHGAALDPNRSDSERRFHRPPSVAVSSSCCPGPSRSP